MFTKAAIRCPGILVPAAVVCLTVSTAAETYTPEQNNRVRINLGNEPWKFFRGWDPGGSPSDVSYSDGSWDDVGIPHCYNDMDTYVNDGEGFDNPYRGTVWYRKRFTIDQAYQGRKIFIEFQGVNIAASVYVNGEFIQDRSQVNNQEATHVHGFVGFAIDVTDMVNFGTQENVLSVRVSNNPEGWYTWPGFGTRFNFSMGMGGIFRPVYLHITDKVYVPLNVYSVVEKWGTYVATVSASDATAQVRVQTNVYNENASGKSVELTTKIVDADDNVVVTRTETSSVSANASHVFDQTIDITNPNLWYPAHSPHGSPYLYRVYSIVKVDGYTADVFESPLGIRRITWDDHFPYFNGHKEVLPGFGQRYEYPALGSAVPEEQQWRDIKLMVDAGGRFVRPGHNASSPTTVAACDAYGVCMAQPSGDDEYTFQSYDANKMTLKKELHRDLIIRDRNNPSILLWETDNGCSADGMVNDLVAITEQWDHVNPRMNSPRDSHGWYTGDLPVGKTVLGQVTACRDYKPVPEWNAESWVAYNSRYEYEWEKEFARIYYEEWHENLNTNQGFAFAQWYLAETQGECAWERGYMNGLPCESGRSLACSAMDGNRIPKLIYHIWRNALWIPYSERPGVALQSHWNYSGTTTVDAWSNCASVELFVNGSSKGVRTPDGTYRRCTWDNVQWESGTLRAEGRDTGGSVVCSDEKVSAGSPNRIVLTVEQPLVRPDGHEYRIQANSVDCGFVLATVVDQNGNWCPLADNDITFSVSGPASYRGSYNFYVTSGQSQSYHAPGDDELMAEGGMMKVAVRSTFTPGVVTVNASSSALSSGSATFTTVPVDQLAVVTGRGPLNHGPRRIGRVYGKSVLNVTPGQGARVFTITGRSVRLPKQNGSLARMPADLAGTVLIISER